MFGRDNNNVLQQDLRIRRERNGRSIPFPKHICTVSEYNDPTVIRNRLSIFQFRVVIPSAHPTFSNMWHSQAVIHLSNDQALRDLSWVIVQEAFFSKKNVIHYQKYKSNNNN